MTKEFEIEISKPQLLRYFLQLGLPECVDSAQTLVPNMGEKQTNIQVC